MRGGHAFPSIASPPFLKPSGAFPAVRGPEIPSFQGFGAEMRRLRDLYSTRAFRPGLLSSWGQPLSTKVEMALRDY